AGHIENRGFATFAGAAPHRASPENPSSHEIRVHAFQSRIAVHSVYDSLVRCAEIKRMMAGSDFKVGNIGVPLNTNLVQLPSKLAVGRELSRYAAVLTKIGVN